MAAISKIATFSLTPGDPAGVDREEVHRVRLEQLLEDDAVGHVLTGGDLDRRDGSADGGQAENLVRARRLLDPVRIPGTQLGDGTDRLRHAPALVGVYGYPDVGSDRFPCQCQAACINVDIGADLQLDLGEPLRDRLPGQLDELLV